MEKHYNKSLEYLLSNDPNDVLSTTGVILRKMFNPLFRAFLPLTTKNKLVVERKAIVSKGENVIFSGTHGFRDDIALTIKTMGTHAYLLYGSILDFYYSIDGYALWTNGVLIVDRKNEISRSAVEIKMEKVFDLGCNNLMYPEGVWNKSPNLLVLKLYPGIYNVARKKRKEVLPIATILEDGIAYSKAGDAYDIVQLERLDYIEVFDRIKTNIIKMIDMMIYPDDIIVCLKDDLLNLLENISMQTLKVYNSKFILSIKINFYQNQLNDLYKKYKQSLLDSYFIEKEYSYELESMISIRKRVLILLKDTMRMERKVALEKLRDKMATLKLELMDEHSHAKRSDFHEYNPISSYWEYYLEDLIKTANGLYDYEIENNAEFIDKTEFSIEEVFEPISKINKNIAQKSKKLVIKNIKE